MPSGDVCALLLVVLSQYCDETIYEKDNVSYETPKVLAATETVESKIACE